jgi:glucose dehydrogenase
MKPIRELFQMPVIVLGIAFFFVGIVEWLLDDQKYWLILGLAIILAGLMIHLSRSKKRLERKE